MTSDAEQEGVVPPDDAFGVLGNETRIQILQALGEAEESMSFTELRDRVGLPQGGQFSYHLEKIVGHFVKKTDEGYILRQPGRRVVQAVLSGAVTDDPELDYTEIDEACWWCGGPIVVRYHQERLDLYCTECAGTYGDLSVRRPTPIAETVPTVPDDLGYLGAFFLPPAGVETRTPEQAYRAGMAWEMLEYLAISNGICPRCSSAIDRSVQVCEAHDDTEGLCGTCGNRKAINMQVACRSCIYRNRGTFVDALYNNPEVMAFFTANGVSLFSPYQLFSVSGSYEEEILSTDPFEGRFTFTMGDQTLSVTVDDTFSIVESVRS